MDLKPADAAAERDGRLCPHCGDRHIHRWGKPGGSQRYRCRSCGRTFNALTGTACAGLRRAELWIDYRAAIVEQLSIRKAAKRCGINPSTALRWRRRLMTPVSAVQDARANRAAEMSADSSPGRRDNLDFVDWVHTMRAKDDGGSMRAHVDRMFGLGARSGAGSAPGRRAPKQRRRTGQTPR